MIYTGTDAASWPHEILNVMEMFEHVDITDLYYDSRGGYAQEGYLAVTYTSPDGTYRISGSGIRIRGQFQLLVRTVDEMSQSNDFVRRVSTVEVAPTF